MPHVKAQPSSYEKQMTVALLTQQDMPNYGQKMVSQVSHCLPRNRGLVSPTECLEVYRTHEASITPLIQLIRATTFAAHTVINPKCLSPVQAANFFSCGNSTSLNRTAREIPSQCRTVEHLPCILQARQEMSERSCPYGIYMPRIGSASSGESLIL